MRLFLAAAASFLCLASAAALHSQQPCTLLTPARIASVLGHPMNAGTPGPKNCVWSATDNTFTHVYLSLRDPGAYASFKSAAQATGQLTPAPGLGDDAFYVGTTLYVHKGSQVLLLRAGAPKLSDAQVQAAEKTLAATAISSF